MTTSTAFEAHATRQDMFILDATSLLATFPGPAVIAAADGAIVRQTATAGALADAVRADLEGLAGEVARVAAEQCPVQKRIVVATGDGGQETMDLTILPAVTPRDQVLILARDATLERNLTQALLASRQLYKDIVVCSADFAFETDKEGRFGFVSPQGALGYAAHELKATLARDLAADQPAPEPFPLAARHPADSVAVRLRRKNGEVGQFEVSAVPVLDASGAVVGTRGLCRDVTEAHAREAELARANRRLELLSSTDALTGALNPRAFAKELARRMADLVRHRRQGALFYIDLDNFKAVNDTAGHSQGDKVLKAVARMMVQRCRAGDLVARLGGDEFAIWQQEVDILSVEATARRLQEAMAEIDAQFGVPGSRLGFSIGIALTDGTQAAESLMKQADAVMYQVKRSGKGAIQVVNAETPALLAEGERG